MINSSNNGRIQETPQLGNTYARKQEPHKEILSSLLNSSLIGESKTPIRRNTMATTNRIIPSLASNNKAEYYPRGRASTQRSR